MRADFAKATKLLAFEVMSRAPTHLIDDQRVAERPVTETGPNGRRKRWLDEYEHEPGARCRSEKITASIQHRLDIARVTNRKDLRRTKVGHVLREVARPERKFWLVDRCDVTTDRVQHKVPVVEPERDETPASETSVKVGGNQDGGFRT